MSKRPGWYPDPFDASEHAGVRYWNGQYWTADAMNRWQLEATRAAIASGPDGAVSTTYADAEPGGWWHRLAALLVDQVLAFGLICVAFWGPISEWLESWRETTAVLRLPGVDQDVALAGVERLARETWDLLGPMLLGSLALQISFFVLMVALFGGSPGKLLVGLRIVAVDGGGVGFGTAVWRWTIPFLLALIPVVGGFVQIFDYLRPAWHPRKQALHDSWAGTVVVRRPRTATVATRSAALASPA